MSCEKESWIVLNCKYIRRDNIYTIWSDFHVVVSSSIT